MQRADPPHGVSQARTPKAVIEKSNSSMLTVRTALPLVVVAVVLTTAVLLLIVAFLVLVFGLNSELAS